MTTVARWIRPRIISAEGPDRWGLFLIACLAFAGTSVSEARAQKFEYAEDELPFTLNPLHESSMAESRLNELLYESLWGPGYDGRPEPGLAEGYELSADRLEMTIFLRPNLLWSDGEAITSQDIKFTVDAYQSPRTRSPDRSRLAFIKKVEVVDEVTAKLQFLDPEPEPLQKLYFKVLPKHRFSGPGVPRNDPFWFGPTTSGPFKLLAQDLGTWSLQRNGQARRKTQIPEVKVREMPDKNQQVSSLGYGYIQAMVNVPAQYLPEVERSRTADLVPYQSKSWWYLGMNQKNSDLKKVPVRSAIAHSLDLDEALSLIGEGSRISGPFVPSSKYYNHSETVPLVQLNNDEARVLLEAAGYSRVEGKWMSKGKPLSLRLFYRAGLGDQGQAVALNLQAQLRRAGIDASDPIAMDKAVWAEKVFKERDFDLVLDSWSFDKNENIFDLFHSQGTQNFVSYGNKDLDVLLSKAVAESDPAAKVAYMRETHRLLAQDLPYVFLWNLRSYTAIRREVESVYIQPFYYFTQFSDWRLRQGS